MIIGYARVSTHDQNLNLQIDALKAAGCERIFKDKGVSGAALMRSGLNKAFSTLKPGDTFIVWRLDRLGRSIQHLIRIAKDLQDQGVQFRSICESLDTRNATGYLLFHILAALAEFERNLISERTHAGLDAARARGVKLGRPRILTPDQISQARAALDTEKVSLPFIAESLGVDRTTLWRALRDSHE